MQFLRSEFSKAFNAVARAASGKVKAVLGNVRLKVENSVATLLATDTEISIMYSIVGVESSDLDILLPVDKMSQILSLADSEYIGIEQTESGLVVSSGLAEFDLPSFDSKEFPWMNLGDGIQVEIPSTTFVSAIRATEFCSDVASTRYMLGGVAMDLGGGVLTFVATDGRRLASYEVQSNSQETITCIVPQKSCKILASVCEGDGVAIVTMDMNWLTVQSGNVTVVTRLIEGRFPNWRQVIPTIKDTIEIPLQSHQFNVALQQAAIVSDKESRGVVMQLTTGQVKLSAKAEVGKAKVTLPVAYDGEQMEITFDYKFASEFLKAVESGSTVQLYVGDPNRAMVWRSGDSYQYIVMPMAKH